MTTLEYFLYLICNNTYPKADKIPTSCWPKQAAHHINFSCEFAIREAPLQLLGRSGSPAELADEAKRGLHGVDHTLPHRPRDRPQLALWHDYKLRTEDNRQNQPWRNFRDVHIRSHMKDTPF